MSVLGIIKIIFTVYILLGVLVTWLVEYRYDVISKSDTPVFLTFYSVFCWGFALLQTLDDEDENEEEE